VYNCEYSQRVVIIVTVDRASQPAGSIPIAPPQPPPAVREAAVCTIQQHVSQFQFLQLHFITVALSRFGHVPFRPSLESLVGPIMSASGQHVTDISRQLQSIWICGDSFIEIAL